MICVFRPKSVLLYKWYIIFHKDLYEKYSEAVNSGRQEDHDMGPPLSIERVE